MNAAHQAVTGGCHKQHACNHTAGVVDPQRRPKVERTRQIFKARVLQNREGVARDHLEDNHCDQGYQQKCNDLTRTIIYDVDGGRDRALPGGHVFRRFTRCFGAAFGYKLVRDFQVIWIRLVSHVVIPSLDLDLKSAFSFRISRLKCPRAMNLLQFLKSTGSN